MRLWSLHPRYLDSKGLVALWREGLLARAVLLGLTKGYQNHPQLIRFRNHPEPISAIDYFLEQVFLESKGRGYHFSAGKITLGQNPQSIPVSSGQVEYEIAHLSRKLAMRCPERLPILTQELLPQMNPFFIVVTGDVETWEKQLLSND